MPSWRGCRVTWLAIVRALPYIHNFLKGAIMGPMILKLLMGGLGERVIVSLLVVVLERAHEAAKDTATPIDDAVASGVLDALRQIQTTGTR